MQKDTESCCIFCLKNTGAARHFIFGTLGKAFVDWRHAERRAASSLGSKGAWVGTSLPPGSGR